MSFTETLVSARTQLLLAATQAPFLKAAGEGSLPAEILSSWLSQDRLYALGYINFVGNLLAKVKFDDRLTKDQTLAWKTVKILSDALSNILREIAWFEETASKYSLLVAPSYMIDGQTFQGANHDTQAYLGAFARYSSQSATLLEGITLLYATEYCYLTAWTYAAESGRQTLEKASGPVADALSKEFIPNWTSEEFKSFVRIIGQLCDELAEETTLDNRQSSEKVFSEVLDLERRFWPTIS